MKKIMTVTLLIALLSLPLLAHKDAPVSSGSVEDYAIDFGTEPIQAVRYQPQVFSITVMHAQDADPIQGLTVNFKVYDGVVMLMDATPSALLEEYAAKEVEPGIYKIAHVYEATGNYLIAAELYEGGQLLTVMSKNVSAEPAGPSPLFWLFMLVSVIIAIFVARKSHEIM